MAYYLSPQEKGLNINQLQPSMNGVNMSVIVIEPAQLRRTAVGGTIHIFKVGDPTGCINMTLMNCDVGDAIQPGDIIKLKNAFTNIHRGGLTLSCGRMGEFFRIGEFYMAYSEVPNFSDFNQDLAALERSRKPSPPEDGEVGGPGGNDPRRNSGSRMMNNQGHKRPGNMPPGVQNGGIPPKRADGGPPFRGRM